MISIDESAIEPSIIFSVAVHPFTFRVFLFSTAFAVLGLLFSLSQ